MELVGIIFLIALFIIIKTQLDRRRVGKELTILPERFVVLDLETTGLDPDKHEIIEIGAIKVHRDSSRHETFQVLVKPSKKLSKKIIEITGITQQEVDRGGVPLDSAIKELITFLGDLRLVSYNAEFDMAFLHRASTALGTRISNPVSCALTMARRAWPGLESYHLTDLAKRAGLQTKGAHRALKDSEMTMTVYAGAAIALKSIS